MISLFRAIFSVVASQPDSLFVYFITIASTVQFINIFSMRSYVTALICTVLILVVWAYAPKFSLPSVDINPRDSAIQALGLHRQDVTKCTDSFFFSSLDTQLAYFMEDMFGFLGDVGKVLNFDSWGNGSTYSIVRIPVVVCLLPLCVLHFYFGCVKVLVLGSCFTVMRFLIFVFFTAPCLVMHNQT